VIGVAVEGRATCKDCGERYALASDRLAPT